MEVNLALPKGLSLTIGDSSRDGGTYPTRRLQKGLVLLDEDEDLAEEGVGFGVPLLKKGVRTIFPGSVELRSRQEGRVTTVTAAFEMDLVERLARRGGARLRSRSLYAAKNSLAALHRRAPLLRAPLTATSNALRRAFGWDTTFEKVASTGALTMTYVVRTGEGRVGVTLEVPDAPLAGVTEVVVMNELGAHHFDLYTDSDGASLRGGEIGTWDAVTATRASFVSTTRGVAFSLGPVEGARLYRGRELIGSRVAWSGFGYSFPPARAKASGGFGYDLRIDRA